MQFMSWILVDITCSNDLKAPNQYNLLRLSSGEASPTFGHANANLNHYVIHFFRN
jgi:hypothetical protein